MKGGGGQSQNYGTSSLAKPFNAQLHVLTVLSYFFLFGCGLTVGVIFTSFLKNSTLNLSLTQFSLPKLDNHAADIATDDTHQVKTRTPRIGFADYLKVPPINHDMDDDELLWRASMAPGRTKYPFRRVPKVAFLFLTKGPVLMAPLWEKFFKGHRGLYSVYIHSNPSYNGSDPETPAFHGRRIPSKEVKWGYVNMIEAERRLLANALLDISNERFVLLSESCIPLFNFSTVYSYLINSTQSHVESYDLKGPVGLGRYSSQMGPNIKARHWRKGSQWFEMDRTLAQRVVSDQKYFPTFQNYCKGPCYADEHYLPTFVNIEVGEANSNRTLTWVDWSKGGPHPARYIRNEVTVKFLEKLRSGSHCLHNGKNTTTCYLFARKFLPNALDRLLRFAPKVMRFN